MAGSQLSGARVERDGMTDAHDVASFWWITNINDMYLEHKFQPAAFEQT